MAGKTRRAPHRARGARAEAAAPATPPLRNAAEPGWIRPAAWALVAATGIALLAIALGPHRVGDYYAESDFYGGYAEGARGIQHGRIDAARYGVAGPAYEVALALAGFVTRDLFAAGEVLSIAAALGTLLLWFELLRRRIGGLGALASVTFLAVNPTFFRYGYSVTSDMPALFVEAAALFALLAMRRPWAPFVAGVLVAFASLTRYSAVALFPGAMIVYAVRAPAPGRSRGSALALQVAGFALVALPWLVFALRAGAPPGAMLFHDIAYDIYANARGTTWAEYQTRLQPGFHSFVDVLLRDPAAVFRREAGNLRTHVSGDARTLLGWPVAALCAAGLLLAAIDRSWRRLAALALPGGLLYLCLVPAFYSERYSLALAPFYLALAGAAVASPLLERRPGLPMLRALAGVPLAFSITASFSAQRSALDTVPAEVIPVARALRSAAAPGARVMALKSQIAFYARLGFVPMPATSRLPELADACRRAGAAYLYYSWVELNNRPAFWYLLDPQAVVPGLTRVAFEAGHPAALYQVGTGFGVEPGWLAADSARTRSEARVIAGMPAHWAWRGHVSLALAALEQGRFRDALEHAAVVTREQPGEAVGWRLYGDAAFRVGERERAIAAFERALVLEPDRVDTRVVLGSMLLMSGQADRAAATWRPVAGATTNRATLQGMVALFHSRGDREAEQKAREALGRLTN